MQAAIVKALIFVVQTVVVIVATFVIAAIVKGLGRLFSKKNTTPVVPEGESA